LQEQKHFDRRIKLYQAVPENLKLFDRKVFFRIDFLSMMLQNTKLYWLMKNYLFPWLYVTAPEQCIVAVQYIKGIKFLPKVIGDVWHNSEGS